MPKNNNSDTLESIVSSKVTKQFDKLNDDAIKLQISAINELDREMMPEIKRYHQAKATAIPNHIGQMAVNLTFSAFDSHHKSKIESSIVEKFKNVGKTPEEKAKLKEVGQAFVNSTSIMHEFGTKVERTFNGVGDKIDKVARSIETGLKDLFGHVCDWLSGKTKKKEMIEEIKKTTEEVVQSAPMTAKEKAMAMAGYAVPDGLQSMKNTDNPMQEMQMKKFTNPKTQTR